MSNRAFLFSILMLLRLQPAGWGWWCSLLYGDGLSYLVAERVIRHNCEAMRPMADQMIPQGFELRRSCAG